MNAIDLLKEDHKHLKKLLDRALNAEGGEHREELLDKVRSELVMHERMEEEIFYPRLRSHEKAKDIVLEGYEEHQVVDVILDELLELPPETELWKAKIKVLKESVEHHIDEEEGDMFKKAKRVLEREELERLGKRMAALRQE